VNRQINTHAVQNETGGGGGAPELSIAGQYVRSAEEVVVLLLAAGLLGVLVVLLLLVVLVEVEGVAAGTDGRRRRDLLRDLVPVRVLGVLLRLVLIVLYIRKERRIHGAARGTNTRSIDGTSAWTTASEIDINI
jgi:hypothetical protein